MIEINGHHHNHDETVKVDQLRDQELAKHNLTVVRFRENEIRKDIVNILRTIEKHIIEHTSHPFQEGN